ncbi:MAG TPA: trehalose-phosphatase [Terriglobia bacterium]|nr:trehalose-phosphatase [Terriglobia bacterium]
MALFLDFDGTLTSFRKRPEQVRMSGRTRRVLERLVRDPRIDVCVLSGRRRIDVQHRVGVRGIRCFGLHGWEGSAPARSKIGVANLLREARQQFRVRLVDLREIWIEEKGPIFAVHVRGASEGTARRTGSIVREVMGSFTPDLRLLPGNKVWEIAPAEMQGKGQTVRALLARMTGAPLPVYVGDDTTDESAFAALGHGITVCVGKRRPTAAEFFLQGPQEVREFLEELERESRIARQGNRS